MTESLLSILYVDDEPLLRVATAEYLKKYQMIVDTVSSGSEALVSIEKKHYDAIVSDYQMPGMNGIELLRQIRSKSDIPFILFTGKGREDVVIEAIETGADFYLQKGGRPTPQFTELTHKVRTAVQRRRDARLIYENELRFKLLIQNSSDIIRILDKDGIITFDSPSSSRILGYPEGFFIGRKAFDFIHPDDQNLVMSDFQDVLNLSNTHTPTEYRILKADGSYLFVESIGSNLMGVTGIDGIITTTHSIQNLKSAEYEIRKMAKDLSDAYQDLAKSEEELRQNYHILKMREEALAKSEERFRSMAERSTDLIILLDTQLSPIYVSPSSIIITGYYPEELIKLNDSFSFELFTEDSNEFIITVKNATHDEPVENLELKIQKKDRSLGFVSLNMVPSYGEGRLTGVQLSIRDITRAKQSELQLRESEEKFRTLVEYSLDGTLILDPVGNIRFASTSAADMVGADHPDEIIGKMNVMELVAPESIEDVITDFKTVASGIDGYIARYKIITLKKDIRWLESVGKTILFQNLPSILISIRDITSKKLTEDALQRASEDMEQIIKNMSSAFIVWDSVFDETGRFVSFRFVYFNDAYAGISGLNLKDVRGKDVFEVWPETQQSWVEIYGSVVTTGISRVFEMYHEPTEGWYHYNAYRPSDTPDRFCVIINDITERRADKLAFEALVRSMVGTTGIESLYLITDTISSWLNADCVLIGEVDQDSNSVNVMAMHLDRKPVHDFRYTFKGSPCESAIKNGFSIYPDDVTKLFPDDTDLINLNIKGYIGTPLYNSTGDAFGILCILFRKPITISDPLREIIDIIAVKAAAEIERAHIEQELVMSENLLNESMSMAKLAAWEYDSEKKLFTFNDRFYSLYGTTATREGGYQMAADRYVREFIHPNDFHLVINKVGALISPSETSDVSHLEHRIIRRDGAIRSISVRIAVERDSSGTIIKTHGVNQDITERKEAEERTLRANKQLNLLTNITRHDILNNVSIGHLYIDSSLTSCTDPVLIDNLEKVRCSIEAIQSQIEFTRIYQDLGSHDPQWIRLKNVIPFSSVPDSITLSTDIKDYSVFANPMLSAVFSNLLDNSIRHGVRVTGISVQAYESGTNLIILWEDNGIGIAPEDKELIFERGYGSNTGIGLFLVREILAFTSITIREIGIADTCARFEITVPSGTFRREEEE